MSFPRYPEYKDSGVEWLGGVPAHWFVGKVKHITSFFTGWTPPTGNAAFYEGENPWANISDLGPKWLVEPSKRISDDAVGHSGIRLSPTGSLLFSFKLSIGQVSFAARDMYTNEAIATFPPSERLNLEFAYYALPLYVVQNASENIYGAKLLNQELIKAAAVAVPSIHEQQAIATFLDREIAKIDALVAEQEKLIALLQEKRQAVISHAVTKGLDSNAPMKDSGVEWLGEVPEHWEVKALKFIATVQTGIAKGKDNTGKETITVPYLRVANVQDGYLALDDMAEIEIPASDLQRYLLEPGDVLMNEGGDFDKLGRGHIWRGEVASCIHQNHVFAVRPHGVSSEWLNALTGSRYAQFYFMTRSKQSTNLASISSTSIMELPVLLPPVSEQDAVLTFLAKQTSQFDTLTAEARTAITLLQERRTALISAAVTGQIDVRGLVGSANAPDSIAASAYPASA